jgi:hypothetical protein
VLPTIVARTAEAVSLLSGVVDRARDATPAWDAVADDVFDFEQRFWLLQYGSKTDKTKRAGRKPQYMHETGGLQRAATQRGASGQKVTPHPSFLLIEVTHGLAGIHEERGRTVLGEPGQGESKQYAETVAQYILTGRTS